MLYANGYPVGGGGGSGSTEIIADDFDSTATYAVGDYCIYDGKLYKCTTAVSTAGQWDSTKWTETLVMDEVGQGGGGETGGHTIIDENGNSMTARAGLQFVGGANVSDDDTDDKTIVDLASAGGIDGVFVDTGNLIDTESSDSSGNMSYTAMQDCYAVIRAYFNNSNTAVSIKIDGVLCIGNRENSVSQGMSFMATNILLKKGQTLTVEGCYVSNDNFIKVYGIQTGTTHSKFQPVIYSTEEREIGVYKDGKPLYQKTLVVGSVGSVGSSLVTPIEINDIPFDYVEVVEANIYDSNNNRRYTLPNLSKTANDRIFLHPYLDKSTNPVVFYASLYTGGNTYSNLSDLSVTIQYTKSTDTAGSGSWTPQGVPAVHYSTYEQVIGTYLGETLYQKTYRYTSGFVSGNNALNFDLTSACTIRHYDIRTYDIATPPYLICEGNEIRGINANYERIVINIASGTVSYIAYIDIIVQYTKSS